MTLICNETGEEIFNPFYWIDLIIKDKRLQKYAESSTSVALSLNIVNKKINFHDFPTSCFNVNGTIVYGISPAIGKEYTLGVSLLEKHTRIGATRYIPKDLAEKCFPNSVKTLLEHNKTWIYRSEKKGDKKWVF